MIELIVTANDDLYRTLSEKARAEGKIPLHAHDVLQGLEQAVRLGSRQAEDMPQVSAIDSALISIVIDMSLRAADTLLETLHSRPNTADIPLLAVRCDGQTVPLALRRLCTDVLESDGRSASCGLETRVP
jgi:hypothetical protein